MKINYEIIRRSDGAVAFCINSSDIAFEPKKIRLNPSEQPEIIILDETGLFNIQLMVVPDDAFQSVHDDGGMRLLEFTDEVLVRTTGLAVA